MIKNILRYLCIIFCIVGIYAILINFKNNIDSPYPVVTQMELTANETMQPVESLELTSGNTIVDYGEEVNSHLFPDCYYALFVDDTDNQIYAAKNVHNRMYPASMTKIMTAIVVTEQIENGSISLEDVVTVQTTFDLSYEDVLPTEVIAGCQITVKDLLYGLMIESNNYFALILAEYVAGDVASFCDMMNKKAYDIGATNTHFTNPHGLDEPEHYSSAYDIYLIIKEAHEHSILRTIATFETYTYTYVNNIGLTVSEDIEASNLFYNGYVELPATYNIEAWKTGTTSGAGHCLVMYLTKNDKTYIAIASTSESKAVLYDTMVELMCLVGE